MHQIVIIANTDVKYDRLANLEKIVKVALEQSVNLKNIKIKFNDVKNVVR